MKLYVKLTVLIELYLKNANKNNKTCLLKGMILASLDWQNCIYTASAKCRNKNCE